MGKHVVWNILAVNAGVLMTSKVYPEAEAGIPPVLKGMRGQAALPSPGPPHSAAEGAALSYMFPSPATGSGPEENEGPKGAKALGGQKPGTGSLSRLAPGSTDAREVSTYT